MNQEIGRVIGTEKRPNTAYTFYFWTDPSAQVGIGSLVKVLAGEMIVYGTVVEAHGFNDLESPLHEFLSLGGEAGKEPPTHRPEMRVFEAAVLRRSPEEPIGAVPIGRVFLADEPDLRIALRTDSYVDRHGIPCGCYGPKDSPFAVHLHSQFLLGPEAGHLNMTGTSGLAAKTSFILFLLKSFFEHHQDDLRQTGPKGVSALLFNTKGGDLLYLDQEPNTAEGDDAPSPEDLKIYESCGVSATPFDSVQYFAPLDPIGGRLATLRDNPGLDHNSTTRLSLSLADVLRHAEVVLNVDDLDAKADSYLNYLRRQFVESSGGEVVPDGRIRTAVSLRDLVDIIQEQLQFADRSGRDTFNGHHVRTMEKMLRRFIGFGERFAGLISDEGGDGPFASTFTFEAGKIYVVDVSMLTTSAQDLLFSAAVTSLRQRMERQDLGVGRLVVVVDELNKYAPSGGATSAVAEALREIAARGRYLGLTLFGAQQFKSRVDKEVVGNAATHVFGHIEAEELAQPGYGYLSDAVKEKLRTLEQGEVLVKHPHFAQPIFVRFPRPGCLKGSDGMRRYPRIASKPPQDHLLDIASKLGLSYNLTRDLIDSLSPTDENIKEVLARALSARSAEELEGIIRRGKVRAGVSQREAKAVIVDVEDPFA